MSIMNRYKLLFCDDDIKYLKRKIQETVEDAYPNTFECTYATDEIFYLILHMMLISWILKCQVNLGLI